MSDSSVSYSQKVKNGKKDHWEYVWCGKLIKLKYNCAMMIIWLFWYYDMISGSDITPLMGCP